jgi:outer membrane protein
MLPAKPLARPHGTPPRLAAGIGFVLLLAGCAHTPPSLYGRPSVAETPGRPWTPPAKAAAQNRADAAAASSAAGTAAWAGLPDSLRALLSRPSSGAGGADTALPSVRLDLAQVVDMALRSSSETRASWSAARSAAAAYGGKRGDWWPDVSLTVGATRQKAAGSAEKPAEEQRTYGPSAGVNWLLFNFGGRLSAIEETRQALVAADWTHNATVQNVVLKATQAYYQYLTAKALLAAEESSLQEAEKAYESAEERRKAGLATVAEVLQAKTALSQTQLNLETIKGEIEVTRGALATAMGLPANLAIDVDLPPLAAPEGQVSDDVERYLEEAAAHRPDLAAARTAVRKSEAHVRKVTADGLPSISAFGSAGRVYRDNPDAYSDPYSMGLQLTLPLFTGFTHDYDLLQSKADADAARARLRGTEQSVTLQVWTSYYTWKTAGRRLGVSEDLVRSAAESHDVALGRYRAGVGTILDLLTAQTTLESARAQQILARSNWYLALAQLAHDTGTLGP